MKKMSSLNIFLILAVCLDVTTSDQLKDKVLNKEDMFQRLNLQRNLKSVTNFGSVPPKDSRSNYCSRNDISQRNDQTLNVAKVIHIESVKSLHKAFQKSFINSSILTEVQLKNNTLVLEIKCEEGIMKWLPIEKEFRAHFASFLTQHYREVEDDQEKKFLPEDIFYVSTAYLFGEMFSIAIVVRDSAVVGENKFLSGENLYNFINNKIRLYEHKFKLRITNTSVGISVKPKEKCTRNIIPDALMYGIAAIFIGITVFKLLLYKYVIQHHMLHCFVESPEVQEHIYENIDVERALPSIQGN